MEKELKEINKEVKEDEVVRGFETIEDVKVEVPTDVNLEDIPVKPLDHSVENAYEVSD